MPIHILVISPALAKGGMERQLSIFLNHFDRSKIEVTLALLEDNIRYELPSDVKVVHLRRRFSGDPGFYFRLVRQLTSKKYDIINSKISGVNEIVLLFCGLLKIKHVIAEVRNTGAKLHSNHRRMAQLFKIFKLDWWVVCNSRRAKQEVSSFLPDFAKTYFIGNGVDTKSFFPLPDNQPDNYFKIGYAGRITEQKNLGILIQSLKQLQASGIKTQLHLQGLISSMEYANVLKKLAEEAALDEQVFFYDQDTIPLNEFYNMLDVFVLPSFFEGTPNALLEAMSAGCVCVCSKEANTDAFLTSEFTFEATATQALVALLSRVFRMSAEQVRQVKKKNRLFVEENYSIDNMVSRLTGLYEKKALVDQ